MATAIPRRLILALTTLAGVAALAVGLVVGLAQPARAAADGAHASAEEQFVDEINAERGQRGLPVLTVDTELTRVARGWTPHMVADDALSHNPDLAGQVNADWQRLAENVGRSRQAGATESELVDRLHQAFMDSDGHRRNILMDEANRVGVGVDVADDGMMYVTVVFMAAPGGQAQAPIDEGVSVSRDLFDGDADHVVLARSEVFADALGGTALAGDSAPVLFTPGPRGHDPDPVLHPRTRAEIDRALAGSGRVYLLGGASAVSPAVERELARAGYDVARLAGATRIETAVEVAEEVVRLHGRPDEVLLARADAWPDAVSGGAYAADTASPVLVTGSDELHGRVAEFLDRHDPDTRWALGGTAALSEATVAAAGAERVAGSERTATAVAIAERMWGRTTASAGDSFSMAPSHGDTAWASALALAPWSAANDGPQLLTGSSVSPSVRGYLDGLGYTEELLGEVYVADALPSSLITQLGSMLLVL